jgi:hypothetical protein
MIQGGFGYEPRHIIARSARGGEVLGVLPLFLVRSLIFGRILSSTPRANYGGILASSETVAQAIFLRVTRTAFFDGSPAEAGLPTVTLNLTSPPVIATGTTSAVLPTKPATAESTTLVSAPAVPIPEPPQKPQDVAQPRPQRSTAELNPRSASESSPTPNPISPSAPAASASVATNEDDVLALSYAQRASRFGYGFVQMGQFTININNDVTASLRTAGPVFVDDGPQVGSILSAHYSAGLREYQTGRYIDAIPQFTYVIDRPSYLNGHPNQGQYLSTAHYLRGMIFIYHAEGVGRLTLAQQDFEAAIQWNPGNYLPYLELARVYVTAGFKEEATSVLQHLIDLKPEDTVIKEAQKILRNLAPSQNLR